MAEVLEVNQMLADSFEPKRKFRWVLAINGIDAFGLNTDNARLIRLAFQPLLVIWALWSTGAWHAWRNK